MAGARARSGGRSIATRLLGGLFALIGVVLAVGGAWLLWLGGSAYYLLTGAAMLVAGGLMFRRRIAGAWLYVAIFALTLIWALWEADGSAWALVPRLFGPAVLLIATILVLPSLDGARIGRRGAVLGALAAFIILAVGAALIATSGQPAPRPLPPGTLAMRDPSPMPVGPDWPAYGGTYGAQRFSPLTQITPANVAGLKRAWLYHTRDLPASKLAKDKYGAETTPLKVGDSVYLCSAKNILIALDPATGRERWRHDPGVSDEWIPYTAACRGVAYYATPGTAADDLCAARIIEGTLDGRLIAVDARTGRRCADFGRNGEVDIKRGMGRVIPGMVSITSPPTIVRGVVVTGHQVLDGQRIDAPSGVIQGFDAVTGAKRWAWDMLNPGWPGDPPPGETYARGTPNMWTIASGDESLGLVYLPTGNSAGDYMSTGRQPAENRFATSLVALDVTTGRPRWAFQAVHKDVWDYDFGGQATLVDFPTAGGAVPALVLPSKQGDIFVLDRRSGRPLVSVEERRVPQGGVEPQERAPTQPFSTYHTLRMPELTERDMWGMTPIDQMVCRIQFRRAAYDGYFTPPTAGRRWIQYPGYNGGSDWGGIAIDPRRGVIVANYNDMPNHNRLVPRDEASRSGVYPRRQARGGDMSGSEHSIDPQWGAPFAIDVNPGWRLKFTGLLCKEPPYGGIRAIDLRTGRTLWDRPFGTARRNGPFGIPSMLPLTIGTPNNGGAVVTAGGLVFIAAATDNLIRAIDLRTGETLWQDRLPAGGQATPMTYEVGGRQYLVIMAGGHHFMETPIGDELIAYALPR